MGRARVLLAAGVLLASLPAWGARTGQARAAGGIGTASSDFAKVTPASAILFTTVQATAADQASNLAALQAIILGKLKSIPMMGSPSASRIRTDLGPLLMRLSSSLNSVFNGETAVSMLPITTETTARGRVIPQFHILVDAGLRPGVGALALQGALILPGVAAATTTYHGVTVSELNLASLLKMANLGGAMPAMPAMPSRALANVSLEVAVVGDMAILAGDAPTIDAAIDAATGNASSLSANPDYQTTQAQLPDGRVAAAYVHVDLAAESQLVQALMPGRTLKATASGTYSQAFAVSAEPTGLLVTASPRVATGDLANGPALTSLADTTAGIMPAGALFYAAINNPGALIQYGLQQAAVMRQASGQMAIDPLKLLNRILGIDFNQDVLSWMNGEASVALLPNGAASAPTAGGRNLSLVLTFKIDNQAQVDGVLHQILGALQAISDNPSRLQVVSTTGSGGVTQEVLAATPDGVGYAFTNGYLVIATALPADVAALQAAVPGATLDNNPQFKAAVEAISAGETGAVMYANLTALRQTLELIARQSGADLTRYNASVQPVLSVFTTLAMAVRPGAAGGGALFLGIGS